MFSEHLSATMSFNEHTNTGGVLNEQLSAVTLFSEHMSAGEMSNSPLKADAASAAAAAFAENARAGPVGKANKDKRVFCAIVLVYTITKVSSSPGASVRAVTVKCPLPASRS